MVVSIWTGSTSKRTRCPQCSSAIFISGGLLHPGAIEWAAKQEKFRSRERSFFLTSTYQDVGMDIRETFPLLMPWHVQES